MNRLEVAALARALPHSAWTQLGALARAVKAADGASFGIVALCSLPYLWLIWRYEFLPMQDLSGHVELSFLHHRLALKDPAYTPFYRVAPQPWPNSLSTLLLSVFGAKLGFERGVKVLLSLYALAWPFSLGVLAKQLGRSPLVALFAIPTILDYNWAFGFFNFLLAKPLVVGAVCAAIAFADRPGLTRGALLVAAMGVTFLAHGLCFGISGVWAGLAVLCFSRGVFRVLNVWPLLLSLVFPVRYVIAQRKAGPVPGDWVFGNVEGMLNGVWHHLGNLNATENEEYAYMLAAAACLLAVTWRSATVPRAELVARGRTGSFFLWLSAIVLFAAHLRGPMFMPNVDIVCQRLMVFVWALLMIAPFELPTGAARWLSGLLMVGAVAKHVHGTSDQYRQFNEVEMRGYSQLLDMVPPSKSMAVLFYRSTTPFARENVMWHWPKLYGVRRGGGAHTDDSFSWRATSYVNLSERALQAGTYAIPPMLDLHRVAQFDYELSHGGPKEIAIANMAPVADHVASSAEWHLFRVRKPPPPAAAPPPPAAQ